MWTKQMCCDFLKSQEMKLTEHWKKHNISLNSWLMLCKLLLGEKKLRLVQLKKNTGEIHPTCERINTAGSIYEGERITRLAVTVKTVCADVCMCVFF